MSSSPPPPADAAPAWGRRTLGAALILEDNIIIALEIEAYLQDIGVENCLLAGSVEAALLILDARDIAFAIVDVNLGVETSEPVAAALAERGLPFAFATGYGEDSPMMLRFPGVPVLIKPFPQWALNAALEKLGII